MLPGLLARSVARGLLAGPFYAAAAADMWLPDVGAQAPAAACHRASRTALAEPLAESASSPF